MPEPLVLRDFRTGATRRELGFGVLAVWGSGVRVPSAPPIGRPGFAGLAGRTVAPSARSTAGQSAKSPQTLLNALASGISSSPRDRGQRCACRARQDGGAGSLLAAGDPLGRRLCVGSGPIGSAGCAAMTGCPIHGPWTDLEASERLTMCSSAGSDARVGTEWISRVVENEWASGVPAPKRSADIC